MKRILPLLLSTLVLVSCGSGDSFTPTPELQATAECAALGVEYFRDLYVLLNNLMDGLPSSFPINTGVTYNYTIATGAYTIAGAFGTITGVVTPVTGTISDGIDVGEAASATWELNGGLAGTAVTGEGTFAVSVTSATLLAVSGSGGFLDGTCQFDFSGFNLADEPGINPVGTITFVATAPDGVLDGVITLNGSNTARVVADFDGTTYTFYVDLVTYEITF